MADLKSALFAALSLALCMGAYGARDRYRDAQASGSASGAHLVQPAISGPYLPIVLWHGMGDSCCAPSSLGRVAKFIKHALPGVFVHSIATGEGESADVWSGFLGNANEQVDAACSRLAGMPQLAGGFVALGFSQGGQMLRALVQRCQHLLPGKVHTLVTLGAQHQGVMDWPGCTTPSRNVTPSLACRAAEAMLGWGAYVPVVQRHVIQAQYFKDPFHLEEYSSRSIFLADLNVESSAGAASRAGAAGAGAAPAGGAGRANSLYRENLASLQRLVLFQFDEDDMVVPKESSHFGVYSASENRVLSMEETSLYRQGQPQLGGADAAKAERGGRWAGHAPDALGEVHTRRGVGCSEDRIGLRALQEGGRLVRTHVPGRHLQMTMDWLREHVVLEYLAVNASGASGIGGTAADAAAAAAW
eukprot:scaffold15.g4235.t1